MTQHNGSVVSEHPSRITPVIEENIRALVARRRETERRQGRQDRLADGIARFTGSMPFVYLHLIVFGTWIVWNLGWLPLRPFDPSLVILAMAASVEAIFLSTFVLINQNRMAALADKRSELDLQISLLAEHEITRLLTLTTAIARRLDVPESNDPELPELSQDVAPEKVMDRIEQQERE